MSRTIMFFVKIFDNEKYAKDFMEGKIYANRLSYFKAIEEKEAANRGDRHEGVLGWYQQNQVQVFINNHLIEGLVSPVSVQMDHHNHLNVFCIYAAHSGEFNEISAENLADFKKQLEISPECLKLGSYAVLITQPKEFIERVEKAAAEKIARFQRGLVEYYDPESFHGSFTEADAVFKKRKDYEHQKEYRFSFDTGVAGESPLELEIGSIKDISFLCNPLEVNNGLKVSLPSGEK